MFIIRSIIFSLCFSLCFISRGQDKNKGPVSVAVLDFSERGKEAKDQGDIAAQLLFVEMLKNENILLVERQDLKKILTENELNLTGAVNPSEAIQVGQLTGAKVILTGSVFNVGGKNYIIAKIISSETSKVLGTSVNGAEGVAKLVPELSKKINEIIKKDINKIIAAPKKEEDVIASIKKKLGDVSKTTVYIDIAESHVNKEIIDPAAQTEFQRICHKLGFKLTEVKANADLIIKGEAVSEFAAKHQNLNTVKARLEVSIVDTEGNVKAVGRQTEITLDLTEAIASKTALQKAASVLAERLLMKLK